MRARLGLLIAGAGAIALPAAAQLAVGPDAGGYLCPDGRQLYVKSCYDLSPGATCGVVNMHLPLNRGQWQVETIETRTNIMPSLAACKVYPVEFRNDGTVGLVLPKSLAPAQYSPVSKQAATTPATDVLAGAAPKPAAQPAAPAAKAVATGTAGSVLDSISASDWLSQSSLALLDRVIAGSSKSVLDSAAKTDARAQALVGSAHLVGAHGYAKNDAAAEKILRAASSLGNPIARNNLALMLQTGRVAGGKADVAAAAALYKLAAAQGHAVAQMNAGALYRDGLGVAKDTHEALRYFRLAAAQGNAQAQYALGHLLRYSYDQQFHREAREAFAAASKTGHADSLLELAKMYESEIDSDETEEYVDEMYADAVAAFKRDAAAGDAYAMRRLAELYHDGEGVTRNYEEARKSYTAASERGDAWSTFQLGRMLARGEGGPKELMNAQLLYLRAAATGDMNVQSAYGELYLKGEDGVAKEQSLAIKLFKLAAAQGEPKAQAHLKALSVKWD